MTEYHNNSSAIVTAATLVTGELQVPFLPFLGYQPTQPPTENSPTTPWIPTPSSYSFNSLDTNSLQLLLQLQLTTENSEVYDLWTDCREDSAFGIGCLAIT
jgi:hypothetical protein